MRIKITAFACTLVALSIAAGCAQRPTGFGVFVEITRPQLDHALEAALAQGRELDFPDQYRFDALRFNHDAGFTFDGRVRLFDPATGHYPPPEINFFGTVPPGWWRLTDGALIIPLASVDGIDPVPGGAASTSQVAERLRDSLGTAIGQVFARMSFPVSVDPSRNWIIGSGTSEDDALRFELRSR